MFAGCGVWVCVCISLWDLTASLFWFVLVGADLLNLTRFFGCDFVILVVSGFWFLTVCGCVRFGYLVFFLVIGFPGGLFVIFDFWFYVLDGCWF